MSIQRKATCYDQCHLWTDFQIAKKEKTGEIFQIIYLKWENDEQFFSTGLVTY